jgi:hypothetical protein
VEALASKAVTASVTLGKGGTVVRCGGEGGATSGSVERVLESVDDGGGDLHRRTETGTGTGVSWNSNLFMPWLCRPLGAQLLH